MSKVRCKAKITSNETKFKNEVGTTCTNLTNKTPYCPFHLAIKYGLRVDKSSLLPEEDGLFAVADFEIGDKICPYGGNRITKQEYKKEEKNGNSYILENIHNKTPSYWDASNPTSSIARFANHAKGHCVFQSDGRGQVNLFTETDIKAGEEIFVNYGDVYFRDEQFEPGSFLDSLTQPKPLHITKYKSKIKPQEQSDSESYDDSNDIQIVSNNHHIPIIIKKRKYQNLFN